MLPLAPQLEDPSVVGVDRDEGVDVLGEHGGLVGREGLADGAIGIGHGGLGNSLPASVPEDRPARPAQIPAYHS